MSAIHHTAKNGTNSYTTNSRDVGSLPADVRTPKTETGHPHEECTAMRGFVPNTRLSPTYSPSATVGEGK